MSLGEYFKFGSRVPTRLSDKSMIYVFVSSNRHICTVLTTGLALRISTHMLALLEGS